MFAFYRLMGKALTVLNADRGMRLVYLSENEPQNRFLWYLQYNRELRG